MYMSAPSMNRRATAAAMTVATASSTYAPQR